MDTTGRHHHVERVELGRTTEEPNEEALLGASETRATSLARVSGSAASERARSRPGSERPSAPNVPTWRNSRLSRLGFRGLMFGGVVARGVIALLTVHMN